MHDPYIALIDRYGLRALVKEDGTPPSHLFQSIIRVSHPNCILIWALLSPKSVLKIRRQLALGDGKNALRIMELNADRVGVISSPNLSQAA